MSEERIIYGFCDANCRVPVYSREETLTILQQLIEAGELQGIDITKSPVVRLIREARADQNISLWVGTEAEYNALGVSAGFVMGRIDASGVVYLCTDDSTLQAWHDLIVADAEQAAAEVLTGKQNTHKTATVTLATGSWASSAQTVSVAGLTAIDTVIVGPAPASADAYAAAGIKCTAQSEGKLTFTCKKTPTAALAVNVVILGV